MLQNGSGESCESASTSSVGSNNSHSKAPGSQLHQKNNLFQNNLNINGNSNQTTTSGSSAFPDFTDDLTKQVNSKILEIL